jgi:hypothetical protein
MKRLLINPVLPAAAAVAGIFLFLLLTTQQIHLSRPVSLLVIFSVAIAAIGATIAIYNDLVPRQRSTILSLGAVSMVLAFTLLVLMVFVQQAILAALDEVKTLSITEQTHQALALALNYIQLGMDVAFDAFYCTGLTCLSVALIREKGWAAVNGIYGVFIATLMLGFNLLTFPIPPANAGLLDLGPFTLIWWIAIIFLGVAESKSTR